MVQKLSFGILAACGIILMVVGGQKWLEHREVSIVIDAFMTALIEGDRDAMLELLPPDRRAAIESTSDEETATLKTTNSGIEYRIKQIGIDGDRAFAQLWIEKRGSVVRPMIELVRSETSRWKITRVDLQEQGKLEGRALSVELGKALKKHSGVSVERVP